jgi:ribosomal RNA-processing protein 36
MEMIKKEVDLSFEELLKLRNEVGSKAFKKYNNANSQKFNQVSVNLRKLSHKNDESPLELSSKIPVKQKRYVAHNVQSTVDPRFNDRCGKFNEEKFRKNYQFAFDMRDQEVEELKKIQEKDEKQKKKAKYLIQRMENQKREYNRKVLKPKSRHKLEKSSDGSKFYVNKNLLRAKELVDKFKTLKEAGSLEKHLDKRRKKQAGKERKRMGIEK